MQNTWTLLGIITAIGLLIFYRKRAAWGFFLLGIFAGFVIAVVNYGENSFFDSIAVAKAAVLGGLSGVVYAMGARLKKRRRTPKHQHEMDH